MRDGEGWVELFIIFVSKTVLYFCGYLCNFYTYLPVRYLYDVDLACPRIWEANTSWDSIIKKFYVSFVTLRWILFAYKLSLFKNLLDIFHV